MTDASEWTKEIAEELAKEEGIELTDKHFEVLEYLAKQTLREKHLPSEK